MNERILIQVNGIDIWISLLQTRYERASIGIDAPREVVITREELLPKPMAKPVEAVEPAL